MLKDGRANFRMKFVALICIIKEIRLPLCQLIWRTAATEQLKAIFKMKPVFQPLHYNTELLILTILLYQSKRKKMIRRKERHALSFLLLVLVTRGLLIIYLVNSS